jgi:hypothetical protein
MLQYGNQTSQAVLLVGNLCVTKKLSDPICDIRHPFEMIFVEPTHVFFDEMTGNCKDCVAFELGSLPEMSQVTISVVTLFSLTSEISANLFRHVFGKISKGLTDTFLR